MRGMEWAELQVIRQQLYRSVFRGASTSQHPSLALIVPVFVG